MLRRGGNWMERYENNPTPRVQPTRIHRQRARPHQSPRKRDSEARQHMRAFDLAEEQIQENCMTTEEIDRAIAEHLGWTYLPPRVDANGIPCSPCWIDPGCGPHVHTRHPSYSTDLNAMHEAEASLTTHGELHAYRMAIGMDVSAKANRRAIAFLHVIGKWRIE